MQTMEAALSELVANEVVTYDEAVSRSLHPREITKPPPVLAQLLDGRESMSGFPPGYALAGSFRFPKLLRGDNRGAEIDGVPDDGSWN